MVRKKPIRKPKRVRRPKTSARKKAVHKAAARKRTAPAKRRAAARRSPRRNAKRKKTAPRRPRGGPSFDVVAPMARGLGPETGGQAGDTEGLSRSELADSESVEELLEEGQSFEAGVISGIEGAADADQDEVRTRQVPEDDVPTEYTDRD